MRSVTDGDGRLVMRVAATRMVAVPVVVAVVTTVLLGLAPDVGARAVFFGLSLAGLALVFTAFTMRASLGKVWSNGARFGDQDAVRRIRRAIRRDSIDDLTADERLVVPDYAFQSRDAIVLSAVQSAGLGFSIGMNQVSQMVNRSSVEVFNVVLLVAAAGLILGAVVTGIVQDRQRKRFLEHYERIEPVRV
jgi:hypothetical protein